MSCRLQIESLSMTIEDSLVAQLVIEMCSPWISGFANPHHRVAQFPHVPNTAIRSAELETPTNALQYIEWTYYSLNARVDRWHLTQFEAARAILRDVSKTSHDIKVYYS